MIRVTAQKRFFGGLGKGGFSFGNGASSSTGTSSSGASSSGGFFSSSSNFFDSSDSGRKPFLPDFMGSLRDGKGFRGTFERGEFGSMFDKALEWCSVSHAHHIAKRKGIDLRDIKFESLPEGKVKVVVDAPHATPLQIQQLGQEVMEECPMAKFRKKMVGNQSELQMKWERLPDKYDR